MNKLITLILIVLSFNASSQSPQGINYQAVIRNSSGTTVNNTQIGLRLRIIQGTSNGTPVYAETFTETTSNIGLINVILGQGNVIAGAFNTINWANGPYYIEVATDINGGSNYTVMGTQQMMSVPYALYAENSGTAGPQGIPGPQGSQGLSAYQLWLAQGNVGTEQDFLNSLVGPQGPQGNSSGGGPTFIAPLTLFQLNSNCTILNSSLNADVQALIGIIPQSIILNLEFISDGGCSNPLGYLTPIRCFVDLILSGNTYQAWKLESNLSGGASTYVLNKSSHQVVLPVSNNGIMNFNYNVIRGTVTAKVIGYYP